ncbi:MAG: hypothetical protein IJ660_05380 [Alphaproteobacteria bacterium]|nr:hypothetical protein [Alphaproteobacteria bacterium]
MKILKISALVGLLSGAAVFYHTSNAQILQSQVPPRTALIKNLLLQELSQNPLMAEDRESLKYALENSNEADLIGPDCPKYAPMLVHAVNQNALFDNYYNIQGNFGYKFAFAVNGRPQLINYNFYSLYDTSADEEKFLGTQTTIKISQDKMLKTLENNQALAYIMENICTPLNKFLDQNSNEAPTTLLSKMKMYFTK